MRESIRGRWIWDEVKQALVTPEEFHRDPPKRSKLSAPRLISDNLDYVASPIDGKPHTSKSKYYRHIKESGCEIAGNDSSLSAMKRKPITAPDGRKDSLRKAWDKHT